MDLQKQLEDLGRKSFNGDITIDEFNKRVQLYAETYYTNKLPQTIKKNVCECGEEATISICDLCCDKMVREGC